MGHKQVKSKAFEGTGFGSICIYLSISLARGEIRRSKISQRNVYAQLQFAHVLMFSSSGGCLCVFPLSKSKNEWF
eukprot:107826-Amphidinium_carterae.1